MQTPVRPGAPDGDEKSIIDGGVPTGKAKEVLDEVQEPLGVVPNFFKVQADVDPHWAELNWLRFKRTMLVRGELSRKTKELIAMAVAIVSNCEYCSLAHEAMARACGGSSAEVNETKMIVELFASFSSIATSFKIPCDFTPEEHDDPQRQRGSK